MIASIFLIQWLVINVGLAWFLEYIAVRLGLLHVENNDMLSDAMPLRRKCTVLEAS